ncbi:12182_t:CDS:2 [Ambispora leptoticha]|uniref:histidine--tRNA ligase n=1 Tax=Ambispora leptoticha TaxID=144679 RepID=A0A9N9E680_9GLOM|nr:12182_t:CDS:2 [Ambispora leptoticha]
MNTGKTATGKDYVKDEIISTSISLCEPPSGNEKIKLVLKLPNLSEAEFENYSPKIKKPIIFPTFEAKELFASSLGSTTDIIHKEMYTFQDRKGREMALRPEGTASTVRLVGQNKLIREGVELVNAKGVIADYQILKLTADILWGLGIKNFTFNLNYLGDGAAKEKYKKELKKFVEKNNPNLCEDCQRRYKTNPLRLLDCLTCKKKNNFPSYKTALNKENADYINELKKILDKFQLPYQSDYYLVRGLDYYTGLVFEVDLGTEKAILGGGRYDNLYQEIGDINAPAVGFAMGIERLVDYLENSSLLEINEKVDIFFLAITAEAYFDILVWKEELKKYPLVVDYNLEEALGKEIGFSETRPNTLVVYSNRLCDGYNEEEHKKIRQNSDIRDLKVDWENITLLEGGLSFDLISPLAIPANGHNLTFNKIFLPLDYPKKNTKSWLSVKNSNILYITDTDLKEGEKAKFLERHPKESAKDMKNEIEAAIRAFENGANLPNRVPPPQPNPKQNKLPKNNTSNQIP